MFAANLTVFSVSFVPVLQTVYWQVRRTWAAMFPYVWCNDLLDFCYQDLMGFHYILYYH